MNKNVPVTLTIGILFFTGVISLNAYFKMMLQFLIVFIIIIYDYYIA